MKSGRLLVGASALTATGFLLAPSVASAHTAGANPSCDGLAVSVESFTDGVVTTITIDGESRTRAGNFQERWAWDSASAHTWTVVVDAVEDRYDQTLGNTHKACVSDTSSTQSPVTSTTAAPELTTTTALVVTTAPGETTSTTTAGGTTTTTVASAATTTAPGSVGGVTGTITRAPTGARATRTAGTLPATGYGTGPLAAAGAVALATGGALLLAGRRRSTV